MSQSYQPVPTGPYDNLKNPPPSNTCYNCCLGWCIYCCICCCCCCFLFVTLIGVGYFMFPAVPTFKSTGSKVTTFSVVPSPPSIKFIGEVYFQANSSVRNDIVLTGADINVYYRTYTLEKFTVGQWGTIKALSTSSLTLPVLLEPKNPDTNMVALMFADRLTRGAIPMTFNGTVTLNYIGISVTIPVPTFTQDFKIV